MCMQHQPSACCKCLPRLIIGGEVCDAAPVLHAFTSDWSVIEQITHPDVRDGTSLLIWPNRAMSRARLVAVFVLVALASASVAGFSWMQGNVFAPAFAALELSAFAVCLWLVWQAGKRAEVLAISQLSVVLRALPDLHDRFLANPRWTELRFNEGRLTLVSHGKSVEVGAHLGEAERASLAKILRERLGEAASGRTAA